MAVSSFKTDLNCGSCVAAVAPGLDADSGITDWSVDTSTPSKVLTVRGPRVDRGHISDLLAAGGFHVFEQVDSAVRPGDAEVVASRGWWETYRPLLLIVAYLSGGAVLLASASGRFEWRAAMNLFMAGFFLVFSYFKLLDLQGFATAFAGYDILARRSVWYARAYPFIELGLGGLYLTGIAPLATNLLALIVMTVGLIGVGQTLGRGRIIPCACLGTGFNLPMSTVTLIEDAAMAAMAATMLLTHA